MTTAKPELSGETIQQREEVCDAWHALPDDLRKDPRLTRLYHALGGPRMDDPAEADPPPTDPWDRAYGVTEAHQTSGSNSSSTSFDAPGVAGTDGSKP